MHTYRCECGYEHTPDPEGMKRNRMVRKLWIDDPRKTGREYVPPWLTCGKCFEGADGREKQNVRMWPVVEEGRSKTMVCQIEECGFSHEMPEGFGNGWRCPKCLVGRMQG